MKPKNMLRIIKLVHTLIWIFFVCCITLIPVAGHMGDRHVVIALIVIVCIEVAVIAINRGECPLTRIAARYTDDRRDNFDIYLPVWLARHNQRIFGSIFVAGTLYALVITSPA